MRVLELFAGYGSQALALENIGIDFTSDISEIDNYAIQAYNQLHGETHNWGDITKIDETKLPYYDLITYSSPCQDFSVAGLQRGGTRIVAHVQAFYGNANVLSVLLNRSIC